MKNTKTNSDLKTAFAIEASTAAKKTDKLLIIVELLLRKINELEHRIQQLEK